MDPTPENTSLTDAPAPGLALDITPSEALERLRGELLALPAPIPSHGNLDAGTTAMKVLSLVDAICCHRAAILELIGERAVRPFDRLELVALAALGAHLEVVVEACSPGPAPIEPELHRLRQRMRAELLVLTQRGLIDERAAREVTGRRGHRHLCLDVLLLTTVFQTHRAVTEANTSLTASQLAEAEALASALMASLGPQPRSAAEDLRARALALLVSTYAEVQRALDFLRWHECDAHLIAPSLWKRPGAGRRRNPRPADAAQRDAARVDALPDDEGTER